MLQLRVLEYGWVNTKLVDCPVCNNFKYPSSLSYEIKDYLNRDPKQFFRYISCRCGVFYLRNQPVNEDIHLIYSNKYEAYRISKSLVSLLKQKRMSSLVKPLLSKERETRILDYGCGSGEFLYAISSLAETTLIGYDINAPSGKSDEHVTFTSDESIVKSLAPFDLIFSFQVIEHLPDPFQFLKFLYSLLNNEGTVIIETPSSSGLLFLKSLRMRWGGWHAPRHFVIFQESSLSELCLKAGFEVISIQYIPSPFQWIETIRTFFPSNSIFQKSLSLDNFFLVSITYFIDVLAVKMGFKTSNMKFVLKKINSRSKEVSDRNPREF